MSSRPSFRGKSNHSNTMRGSNKRVSFARTATGTTNNHHQKTQRKTHSNTSNRGGSARNTRGRPRRKETHRRRSDHVTKEESEAPKSFVIVRGRVTKFCKFLRDDLRVIFSPFTAVKLQEKHSNSLKDFESAATDFGVTHILTLSQSDIAGTMLRMIRLPKGPTFWFRVTEYALIQDIVRMQSEATQTMLHWRAMNAMKSNKCLEFLHPHTKRALQTPPLVILNGFGTKSAGSGHVPGTSYAYNRATQFHRQLMAVMFKHMFMPMNVIKLRLTQCKRVVFFNYDHATDTVQVRHYKIELAQDLKEVSSGIKKLVKKKRKAQGVTTKSAKNSASSKDAAFPDLSEYKDITDYVEQNKDGYASESEAEDDEQTRVVLEQVRSRLAPAGNTNGGGSGSTTARFVRLKEIGPRIAMQLIKIEEQVNDGRVLYHRFVQKTEAEMAELQRRKEEEQATKEQRKVKQMMNVQQKERTKKEKANEVLEQSKKRQLSKLLQSFDDKEEEEGEEVEMMMPVQSGQKRERDGHVQDTQELESKQPQNKKRKM